MSNKNNFDQEAKLFFGDNEVFARIFNYLIYDGKDVIKPNDLESLPTELVLRTKDAVDSRLRDLIKKVSIKEADKSYLVLFGIESQNKEDHFMIQRVMNYNVRQMLEQAKGLKKGELLKPVLTLVIYTGEKRWEEARTLYETLDIPKSLMDLYKKSEPDRELLLLDLRRMKDEEIRKFGPQIEVVFLAMKYQYNSEKIDQIFKEGPDLEPKYVEALKAFTNREDINYNTNEEEVTNMRSLSDTLKDIGRDEGSSNAYYNSVKGAMESFGVSADRAMDALKVPQEDREAILKKIEG